MESIYRSIIMKNIKVFAKGFCLSALLLCLCILSGCGEEEQDRERRSRRESRVEDEDESKDTRKDREEGTSAGETSDKEASKGDTSGGASASGTEDPLTMMQLLANMNEAEDTAPEIFPDTVLWFNATYAPLTYSNRMDWRLAGGLSRTYYNENLTKNLLKQSWDVVDRESAIETIEWLKEEGHRKTYREYLEELEQLGMLDLDVNVFLDTLVNTEMEGALYRYVIVYYLYQEGMDEDVIAAWDLCRINQLCGDYYVCGYMTYEEAMDISLENSLVLQEKYSSWDDLMDSYLLGYQFWQSDPCLSDDSPTLQRYHYYEELLEMQDGPYSLDWNMKLKKEW